MPPSYSGAPMPEGEAASGPSRPERLEPGEQVSVVVVAAGESRRMDGLDKIFTPVLGRPLIAHTIDALEACPLVSHLVLVLAPDRVPQGQELAGEYGWRKLVSVCQGGQRRQDSVLLGLDCLAGAASSWVAVHDGARPCVSHELLERGVEAAQETGAAVAAVPAKDTVKVVSPNRLVEATPPRDRLWLVQTPQVFRYDLLLMAHRSFEGTATDDAAMVEGMGEKVKVYMGSYDNLKVTTPDDLAIAELFLGRRQRQPARDKGNSRGQQP